MKPKIKKSMEEGLKDIGEEYEAYATYKKGAFLTISELIALLRRENFEVTSQQVKKYEDFGLMTPADKTHSNYRLYDGENVSQLRVILSLRVINISLKRIKRYFGLVQLVKEFADKYFVTEVSDLSGEIKTLEIFSDETIKENENTGPYLEKKIDRSKLNGMGEQEKKDVRKKLLEVNELSLMIIEFNEKWEKLRDIVGKYYRSFSKKGMNVTIIAKEIERVLGER